MNDLQEYINNGGHGCINCDDAQATGGDVEITEQGITQDMTCPECEAVWTNHYEVFDVSVQEEGTQYAYTDEDEVRAAFQAYCLETGLPYCDRSSHNEQHCDTRSEFTVWIDGLARGKQISNTLAGEVTI